MNDFDFILVAAAVSKTTNYNYIHDYLPLITALVTFILTSVFSIVKDHQRSKKDSRVIFNIERKRIPYHIEDQSYGWGRQLLDTRYDSDHEQYVEDYGNRYIVEHIVIKNITSKTACNVFIKVESSYQNELIKRNFLLPVISSDETIYIPTSLPGATFMTDEYLSVDYRTEGNERMRYIEKKIRLHKVQTLLESFFSRVSQTQNKKKVKKTSEKYKSTLYIYWLHFIRIPLFRYKDTDFFKWVHIK
ncbi:hypothetical protein [Sporolactobacillus nakayamae]|uniref:Uncharacterized protein n=1 Tax=Sporolactobacillus nakayamae TaxID=269670 RepID=A0A1I2U4J1_9BACL|nr:hypothetical protein [Sporolactobacillus nakayamae]SFG70587.1 hypothetical protein SAMN02982927_02503 [Sporolactobacillus nakayamae]